MFLLTLATAAMLGTIILITHKSCHTARLKDKITPQSVYKIIKADDYLPHAQDNCINHSEMDKTAGFIHASFGTQILPTLDKFFHHKSHVILLELDTAALANHGTQVVVEQNKPNGSFYPHLHGSQAIPSLAIIKLIHIKKRADGAWHVTKQELV